MEATSDQLTRLRDRRIAITSAADALLGLVIEQSGNLNEAEAAEVLAIMSQAYDKLDDVVDILLAVEERGEG